jgi:cyclophilin family peptidyl-prolyl cis-trans isomerase/HEAT repeat protein
MYRIIIFSCLLTFLLACSEQESGNDFQKDATFIKIADLQDRRNSDSLISYFKHENPSIRNRAVLAFASVQDSAAVAKLTNVLSTDADTTVRISAAVALGQTRSRESEKNLKAAIEKESADNVRAAIIEAYGRVTRNWDLNIDVEKNPSAVAWSLYRASFNNAVDASKNSVAATLLDSKFNDNTRLGAAHFFSRGAKDITNQFSAIAKSALNDKSVDVRMASASALRKVVTDSSFVALEKILSNDPDYRVRIGAVRGFQASPFERSKNNLLKALRDKNVNVGIAASEAVKATLTETFWIDVANVASESKNWRVQANLYEAVLKVKNNKGIIDEVIALYKTANPYQKRGLLYALQNQPSTAPFIQQELLTAQDLVVKTSAADALVAINKNKDFEAKQKKAFADVYQKAIEAGDPTVITTISSALADSTLAYRGVVTDYQFIATAKQKLVPVKDDDAIAALDRANAYFEKRKPAERVANTYNHPINWARIKELPSDQHVTVFTSKGKIKLRLLVDDAPGSVANFLDLVDKKYFNNHYFHRVVPNFVIQVGDKRGDGSGGEDYTIRSEFTKTKYKTGSVGMASSGKDTEGTQWFITHSPTPHLDGRYTIFAEVVEGMETVHAIEVGDQITKIELEKTVGK